MCHRLGHLQGVLDGAGWNGALFGLMEQGMGSLTGSESHVAPPSGIASPFPVLVLVHGGQIWSHHIFGALGKGRKRQIRNVVRE